MTWIQEWLVAKDRKDMGLTTAQQAAKVRRLELQAPRDSRAWFTKLYHSLTLGMPGIEPIQPPIQEEEARWVFRAVTLGLIELRLREKQFMVPPAGRRTYDFLFSDARARTTALRRRQVTTIAQYAKLVMGCRFPLRIVRWQPSGLGVVSPFGRVWLQAEPATSPAEADRLVRELTRRARGHGDTDRLRDQLWAARPAYLWVATPECVEFPSPHLFRLLYEGTRLRLTHAPDRRLIYPFPTR